MISVRTFISVFSLQRALTRQDEGRSFVDVLVLFRPFIASENLIPLCPGSQPEPSTEYRELCRSGDEWSHQQETSDRSLCPKAHCHLGGRCARMPVPVNG